MHQEQTSYTLNYTSDLDMPLITPEFRHLLPAMMGSRWLDNPVATVSSALELELVLLPANVGSEMVGSEMLPWGRPLSRMLSLTFSLGSQSISVSRYY